MGKGSELLHLLRTGNSGEARKIIGKIKKQGTFMCIYIYIYTYIYIIVNYHYDKMFVHPIPVYYTITCTYILCVIYYRCVYESHSQWRDYISLFK